MLEPVYDSTSAAVAPETILADALNTSESNTTVAAGARVMAPAFSTK
jgi:hypothetical protein